MEKRTILAAVLMVALLIIYQAYFLPPAPEPGGRPPAEQQQAPGPAQKPSDPKGSVPAAQPVGPAAAVPAPVRERKTPDKTVRIDAPLYRAVVSTEGGAFEEWTLKYRGEKPWISDRVDARGLVVIPQNQRAGGPVPMRFVDEIIDLGGNRDLALIGEADGLEIGQKLEFRPDGYTVDIGLRIENAGAQAQTVTVSLPWDAPQAWKDVKEAFPGQHPTEVVWSNGRTHRVSNLCEVAPVNQEGRWIALASGGYMVALRPASGGFTVAASAEDKKVCEASSKDPVGRVTIALQATPTIPPGQAWEGRLSVFVGPKEYEGLKAVGLEGAINWGCFPIWCEWGGLPMEWLGVPILKLMNWVYRFVGNYGVAIILLTIISKVLFYPLTVKSMRSMRAMQALQPQVNALRSKHRSDPRKMQEETMALYRKHRVNPMGGCLPMVAQIPVFYALYVVLTVSAELQSAPFLCFGRIFGVDLWICDLASVDPLYILPVLMAVTMFIQQKMTPTPADPQQARMMLMMPIVFGGMFIVFPIASGLTLYWTVSNILQIGQQRLMERGTKAPAKTAKSPAKP
jgi:YidC/Oxa1 family membrane protein insertase